MEGKLKRVNPSIVVNKLWNWIEENPLDRTYEITLRSDADHAIKVFSEEYFVFNIIANTIRKEETELDISNIDIAIYDIDKLPEYINKAFEEKEETDIEEHIERFVRHHKISNDTVEIVNKYKGRLRNQLKKEEIRNE